MSPVKITTDHASCSAVGNDARKAIADGFPVHNVIASDLEEGTETHMSIALVTYDVILEFWRLGHTLFKSSAETLPVPFIPGDAFNEAFLKQVPPFYAPLRGPHYQL